MKKFLKIFFILILFLVLDFSLITFHLSLPVRADELSEIQKQIDDLQKQLDTSKNATTPLESQVKSLESQLASISSRLSNVQNEIKKSEDDLVYQRQILSRTVRNLYIRSFIDIPLLTFFASHDAAETLKLIAFQQSSSKSDKNTIREISEKIAKLADDKKRLASAQQHIQRQSQFLKGEIASAKAFQSELEGQIAALTAQQQKILNQRLAALNIPRSAATSAKGCSAARGINPGFSPRLAFFTFGVPNRGGLY